jgi:hypothetical protein
MPGCAPAAIAFIQLVATGTRRFEVQMDLAQLLEVIAQDDIGERPGIESVASAQAQRLPGSTIT